LSGTEEKEKRSEVRKKRGIVRWKLVNTGKRKNRKMCFAAYILL